MSTYRNISTLPLDALRSVTPPSIHHQDQRSPSRNRDRSFSNTVSDKNLQLCLENQKLRRCLSLCLENSDLKTANALSSLMGLCDDKLRNFITERLIEDPVDLAAASLTSNVNSSQQFEQVYGKSKDASTSYGRSFKNIDLNDLGNDTFGIYENNVTKSTSSRRSYSPASQSGSLRPPMRFGVGRSPYDKSPARSPAARSLSPDFHNSSIQQGHGQHISQSKSIYQDSKMGKFSNRAKSTQADVMYDTSITNRSGSAPPIQKMVFDNGGFKVNKSSAFSQVKGKQQCKNCSLQTSDLGSLHSENHMPSAAVGSSPTEKSFPVYINAKSQFKSIMLDRSPNSNYQTAQHLLYDSQSQFHDDLFSGNQASKPTVSTSTYRKIRGPLAKSVNWAHEQKEFEDKHLHAENFRGTYDSSAVNRNRSTQSSFGNNSIDEELTLNNHYVGNGLDTKSQVSDLNHVQGGSVQRDTSTQTSAKSTDWDRLEEIGTPIAASTPVPPQKQKPASQRREGELSTGLLAFVMGLRGPGAVEKAKYVLHRPLDVLIGYHPEVPEEAFSSLAMSQPSTRLLGEIAFQLDRRILEYVFAGLSDKQNKRRSRYYGYSVASIMMLISREVQRADNDPNLDCKLRARLGHILEALQPLGYEYERHSEFTQDIVNKYGLFNVTPKLGTVEDTALHEPAVMRVLVGQLVTDEEELDNMLIVVDCLHFMAYHDKGQLFYW